MKTKFRFVGHFKDRFQEPMDRSFQKLRSCAAGQLVKSSASDGRHRKHALWIWVEGLSRGQCRSCERGRAFAFKMLVSTVCAILGQKRGEESSEKQSLGAGDGIKDDQA